MSRAMAQFPGVPWDQRPDFLALTQRVDPAGIATTYNPPRPGVSATDVTSFVFGQANITLGNWPEIMYYLHPPPEWTAFRHTISPPQKVDDNGQPMVERYPRQDQPARPLLDFRILPDTISSQEELWWIELWRRMDPRIQWQDILMRIEVPNRTTESETKLKNATNNLINRKEHNRFSMLSWHSTGINGKKLNRMRTEVLSRLARVNPPPPHNSTRGLTPGLINPRLGNVPGNRVALPPLRGQGHGRLRVTAPPQVPQPAAAAAANQVQGNTTQGNTAQGNQAQGNPPQGNPAQGNLLQAPPAQNNQGRSNRGGGHRVPSKRSRTSQGPKDRPSKRQAQSIINNDMEDNMNTISDGDKSSEEIPLSVAKAGARAAPTRRDTELTMPVRKGVAVKVKPKSKRAETAKKTALSTAQQQQDSTAEHRLPGLDNNAEDSDGQDAAPTQFFFEGDPGFEEAYQASIRGRGRRQGTRRAPPPPPQDSPSRGRHASTPPSTRPSSRDTVSDSELLGEMEGRTLGTPAHRYPTVPARPVRETPALPTNPPTPARPQAISAITGLPFAGANRRREALGGYGDNMPYRSESPVRGSRVTQATSIRITQDNNGRSEVTRRSIAASIGLPVAPANRPPRSFYSHSPNGNYYQYRNGSETPTSASRPDPSSSRSRIPFDPHERTRTRAQSPAAETAQPAARTPANAPSASQTYPAADDRETRLTREAARHNDVLLNELRRSDRLQRHELARHARRVFDIVREGGPDYVTGFLERELERERREIQGSSDDE